MNRSFISDLGWLEKWSLLPWDNNFSSSCVSTMDSVVWREALMLCLFSVSEWLSGHERVMMTVSLTSLSPLSIWWWVVSCSAHTNELDETSAGRRCGRSVIWCRAAAQTLFEIPLTNRLCQLVINCHAENISSSVAQILHVARCGHNNLQKCQPHLLPKISLASLPLESAWEVS